MGVGESLHPPLNPLPSREGMVFGSPLPEGEDLGDGVHKPHPLRQAQGAASIYCFAATQDVAQDAPSGDEDTRPRGTSPRASTQRVSL
jgi:hypothetical protein